jgi:hypothetical protein
MDTTAFVNFVEARHSVAVARAKGLPKPWTKDPILRSYRFCNVYREWDTVTRWVRGPWTDLNSDKPYDPDLWFAMVVARLINWPDSLAYLGPVLPWNPARFRSRLEALQARGGQVFGPAYIVSTNGKSIPKVQYLAEHVLTPIWERRKELRPQGDDTLASFHQRLTTCIGMGSFMAAQVVADTKNTEVSPLAWAKDWATWAAPGPGSLRGLNRILGKGPVRTGINASEFLVLVNVLRNDINKRFKTTGWPRVCAQDTQNCLCEFDKYERVRLGEGAPKQRYPGAA